jgi:hypothetical protein
MKNKIIGIFVGMLLLATAVSTTGSLKISSVQNTPNNSTLQKLSFQQKALIFGEITNLTTYDECIVFQAEKIKVITFSPFSFNPYISGEYFEILKEHKGFIGLDYIFALTTLHTPEIVCSVDSFIDRLRIIMVDISIKWRDIEISLDTPGATYQVFTASDKAIAPVNNTAYAGDAVVTYKDYIQLSTYRGNVTTTLRYIPTNIYLGSWTVHV